jgi:sarcosine oxidase subunit beta
MSPDGNPLIGPVPGVDGFFLVNGFSGHGFQHSPAAGRIVADLIVGRDPGIDLHAFAPQRFAAPAGGGERYVV